MDADRHREPLRLHARHGQRLMIRCRAAVFQHKRQILNRLLNDGNTVADYVDGVGQTDAGSGLCSSWANQRGSSPAVTQGTGASQPTINLDGSITSNAKFLREASSSASQPYSIYGVLRSNAVVDGKWIFSSGDGGSTGLRQKNTSAYITQAGAATMTPDASLSNGTYGTFSMVFNGASSTLQINRGAITTASIGSNPMTGFTIGGLGSVGDANVTVKRLVRRTGADSAAFQARLQLMSSLIYGTA